jgi:hypothetical protein
VKFVEVCAEELCVVDGDKLVKAFVDEIIAESDEILEVVSIFVVVDNLLVFGFSIKLFVNFTEVLGSLVSNELILLISVLFVAKIIELVSNFLILLNSVLASAEVEITFCNELIVFV